MKIDELLGIDPNDAVQMLAIRQLRNDEDFLDDLISAREACGMSVANVAEAMDVTEGDVVTIEAVDRDPRLSTIRLYALAIGAEIRHSVDPNATRSRVEAPNRGVWESLFEAPALSKAAVSAARGH